MIKQRSSTAKMWDSRDYSVYNRLDNKRDGDSSGEETELYVKNKSPRKEIPTIEIIVEDDDTLQSLAIRHRCTIEDIKRLNSIHKENEIYARRTIKVPHHPFSAALATVHISGQNSPGESSEPSKNDLINVKTLSSKLNENNKNDKNEVNDIIFNSHITQKSIERLTQDEHSNVNEEEICLLPSSRDLPLADPVVSSLNCSGDDCDISWMALIGCIVIIIVAVPLIYVFYIAEHPELYHHSSTHHGT